LHMSCAKAIAVLALFLFAQGLAAKAPATCMASHVDFRKLGYEAYVWGYPLIRSAQLRQNMTLPEEPLRPRPSSTAGAPINRIGHARELADPRTRQGVAPNNDTLYSVAWIDTSTGPYVFEAPDFGDRYYVFQMGQADTTTHIALGQSSHGRRLPPVLVLGPGQSMKQRAGMLTVRSAQRYLIIAGRVLVNGPSDLSEAHRLQDSMRLRRLADFRASRNLLAPNSQQRLIDRRDPPPGEPLAFLEMLEVVLSDWRETPGDAAMLRSLRLLGLRTGHDLDPHCLNEMQLVVFAEGLKEGRAAIERRTMALGATINGWTVNFQGAQFGDDNLLRAAVAMDQIYVLPSSEALYMNAKFDSVGKLLDGNKSYVLHFAKDDVPPARFFWSVTMYYAKGFLVPNEIGRYSIGDRTPDLVRNADGGVTIIIQHERPKLSARVNWLPAPAEPFTLMLRLYGPKDAVLKRRWSPPPVAETKSSDSQDKFVDNRPVGRVFTIRPTGRTTLRRMGNSDV
jgi:hypothetical protein